MELPKATEAEEGWSRWLTQDPGAWPLRRLFWSSRAPQPEDALDPEWVAAVLTTILEEGTAKDWRTIRWHAVWPIWEQLPVSPMARSFWDWYRKEEYAIAHRDHVLDAEQHQILHVAATVLPQYGFELAGGTALAAGYLGHRLSEDLDLFTGDATVGLALRAVQAAWNAAGIPARVEATYDTFARLWVGQRPVKVELAQDSPFRLASSTTRVDGMPVRALKDLAADKTLALFGRATTRDFVDVYVLLSTRFDLGQLLAWARQKDPGFDHDWFIQALTRVEQVQPKRVQMLVPLDWDHLRLTFRQAALRLERQARDSDQDYQR